MELLSELGRIIVLIIHILSVVIAAGAVTVTDYLHIVGLRNKKIERKLLIVYPLLSQMILGSTIIIFFTGMLLIVNNPAFLASRIFQLKLFLVMVVVVNGLFLHQKVYPSMKACVEGKKNLCTKHELFVSSLCGSISLVTWYSILILSLTKQYGYTPLEFLSVYLCFLVLVFLVALLMESSQRTWY